MQETGSKKLRNKIARALCYLITACMGLMVILVFLNAVLRYGFNSSIPESEELSRYLFVWTVFLGAILAFKDNRHISIDILIKRLHGKTRRALRIVGDLFTLCALAVMVIGGISYIKTLGLITGASTGIPLACISVSVVVCGLAIGFMVLKDLISSLMNKA